MTLKRTNIIINIFNFIVTGNLVVGKLFFFLKNFPFPSNGIFRYFGIIAKLIFSREAKANGKQQWNYIKS